MSEEIQPPKIVRPASSKETLRMKLHETQNLEAAKTLESATDPLGGATEFQASTMLILLQHREEVMDELKEIRKRQTDEATILNFQTDALMDLQKDSGNHTTALVEGAASFVRIEEITSATNGRVLALEDITGDHDKQLEELRASSGGAAKQALFGDVTLGIPGLIKDMIEVKNALISQGNILQRGLWTLGGIIMFGSLLIAIAAIVVPMFKK